jgi:ferredoxin
MPEVTVIRRDGLARSFVLDGTDPSLMHALRDLGEFGVAGECGGCRVCGTCHVLFAEPGLHRLLVPSEEERELTDNLLHGEVRSRLACQIAIATIPDGATITIAPEE